MVQTHATSSGIEVLEEDGCHAHPKEKEDYPKHGLPLKTCKIITDLIRSVPSIKPVITQIELHSSFGPMYDLRKIRSFKVRVMKKIEESVKINTLEGIFMHLSNRRNSITYSVYVCCRIDHWDHFRHILWHSETSKSLFSHTYFYHILNQYFTWNTNYCKVNARNKLSTLKMMLLNYYLQFWQVAMNETFLIHVLTGKGWHKWNHVWWIYGFLFNWKLKDTLCKRFNRFSDSIFNEILEGIPEGRFEGDSMISKGTRSHRIRLLIQWFDWWHKGLVKGLGHREF